MAGNVIDPRVELAVLLHMVIPTDRPGFFTVFVREAYFLVNKN